MTHDVSHRSAATPSTASIEQEKPPREMNLRSTLVVVGSTLGLAVSSAPLLVSTQSVFIIPITQEFGWERSQLGLSGLVAGILAAISLPLVGLAIDRWGFRRVMPIGIAVLVLNIVALSFVPGIALAYLAVYGLTGITAAPQNPASYIKTVARWFDANRGLAIGVAVMGIAFGQAIIPQIAQLMIASWGWRNAYLGLAGILVLVALPCVLFLVRDPRAGEGAAVARAAAPGEALPGLTVRESFRTPRFWILLLSIILVALSVQGALIHIVPLVIDRGWDPAAAAGLLAISGLASAVGRLGGGFLYDRFHAPYVGAAAFILGAIGLGILAAGGSPVIAAVLLGICAGAETDLIAFLGSRYFGLRSYGQLNGYFYGFFGLAVTIGVLLLGLGYDRLGSYDLTLFILTGALVFAAVLILLLPRRYTFPVVRA